MLNREGAIKMTMQKYYDINGLEIKSGMTLLIGEKNTDIPARVSVFSDMYEDENGAREELGYEFEETHEFVPLSYACPEKNARIIYVPDEYSEECYKDLKE